jgi:hypothetical protein
LLLAVVDLRVLDVVGADLRDGHRRIDRLVTPGVVTEVEEGPAQQKHDGDHCERADYIFPIHQASAALGQVLPMRVGR